MQQATAESCCHDAGSNGFAEAKDAVQFAVIVSAHAEWRAVAELFAGTTME
jgi:hypothetical protein